MIYHFSAKVIGRSGGRSVVAAAGYSAGERLHDNKLDRDRDHDYTAEAGVVHSEIMLPEGAPARSRPAGHTPEALQSTRERLWNEVEAEEKRKDAQLARDIEISLQRELGKAEAIKLVQAFVQEQLTAGGICYNRATHEIVITLARRGILNSICSKNEIAAVRPILKQESEVLTMNHIERMAYRNVRHVLNQLRLPSSAVG